MKRYYSLIVLIACLSSVAFAQVKFGVVAGVNFSNMRETDTSNDALTGFHTGVFLDCPISTNLYIQPNVLFTQRGCKNENGTSSSKTKLNYLQVPVVLSYRYPLGDVVTFDINVGPYLAMGINGESTIKGELVDRESSTYEIIVTDGIFKQTKEQKELGLEATLKRVDAGFRAGIGMHFVKHLGLSFHYDLGIVNTLNKDGSAKYLEELAGKDIYSKHGSFQLSLSFTY